ncbi:MAG: radical SAM/SPASM domain-containing protein [Dehalococcoidales bacterium]|nr:radical SAM/SPASM domain-containing protein [Dehalococcoidales bacterium]
MGNHHREPAHHVEERHREVFGWLDMSEMIINPGYREYTFREILTDPEYDEYRRQWSENPKNGITSDMPLCLDIEITNRCNLSCPFCVREVMLKDGKKEGQGLMRWDDYMKVMKQIEHKVPSVKLNWRGEPVMHPMLCDMVKQAKKAGVIEVMFNTNGTRISQELATKLVQAGLDKIIFSIESIDAKKYPIYRPGGELYQVVDGIQNILAARSVSGMCGPIVRVQKIDFPELREEDYVKFFTTIEPGGVDQIALNTYKEKDPDKALEVVYNPCCQPFQRLFLAWNGNFYPCCQGHLFEPIGNIKDMRVFDAWHSPLMGMLRKKHHDRQGFTVEQCSTCQTAKGV